MKAYIYVLALLMMVAAVSATTINFVSDSTTKYSYDYSNWYDSVPTYVYPSWPTVDGGTWVWTSYHVTAEEAVNGSGASFQKVIELPACATNIHATVTMGGDNWFFLSLNGVFVGQNWDWTQVQTYDLDMIPGNNTLDISVVNTPLNHGTWETNPAGLVYSGHVTYDCGEPEVPEFGVIAGTIALIGALGIFIWGKR